MIAQIIPLVRLPRKFAHFDYLIAEGITLSVGDVVNIQFKHCETLGVVRGISKSTEQSKLSKVDRIAFKQLLTADDILRLEKIAGQIVQSPSSIFLATLNGIEQKMQQTTLVAGTQLGKIDAQTAGTIKLALQTLAKHDLCFETSLEGAIATVYSLCSRKNQQILILVPRERDAEIFSSYIPNQHAVLHGKTKQSQRRWILENWQSGKLQILIGTRQASLLPASNIGTIIIYDPDCPDHANSMRNPRFDARASSELLAKQHDAHRLFLGPLSRVEELGVNKIKSTIPPCQLVDLGNQMERTNSLLISDLLQKAIKEALQNKKSVLLSYNAKGVAKRLQCKACGHIPLCGTCGAQPHVRSGDLVCPVCKTEMWIPQICPACSQKTLGMKGIGNKKLATDLQKMFPQAHIGIIDKEHRYSSNASIILVTEFYFQSSYKPFPIDRFGLIAEICIDKSLGTDYLSSMTTAQRLYRILHMASVHKAKVIVQTWVPEIIKPMLDAEKFLKSESELRKAYQLPPFTDQFEIKEKADENIKVITCKHKDRDQLLKKLTSLPNTTTIKPTLSSYETQSSDNSE
ncbi:hypothetical protein A2317_01310 [Candidatus Uhrbacteria bacterium RIFOXYB2_FULL_41_10]|nr:MAG: hypothetical protein A2317_01310 [Candidatus Uhrbacteria bacterium RIFOXYB2_FULL_41_10]